MRPRRRRLAHVAGSVAPDSGVPRHAVSRRSSPVIAGAFLEPLEYNAAFGVRKTTMASDSARAARMAAARRRIAHRADAVRLLARHVAAAKCFSPPKRAGGASASNGGSTSACDNPRAAHLLPSAPGFIFGFSIEAAPETRGQAQGLRPTSPVQLRLSDYGPAAPLSRQCDSRPPTNAAIHHFEKCLIILLSTRAHKIGGTARPLSCVHHPSAKPGRAYAAYAASSTNSRARSRVILIPSLDWPRGRYRGPSAENTCAARAQAPSLENPSAID